jgi:hypothetical protein
MTCLLVAGRSSFWAPDGSAFGAAAHSTMKLFGDKAVALHVSVARERACATLVTARRRPHGHSVLVSERSASAALLPANESVARVLRFIHTVWRLSPTTSAHVG